jgi:hypothetical protein
MSKASRSAVAGESGNSGLITAGRSIKAGGSFARVTEARLEDPRMIGWNPKFPGDAIRFQANRLLALPSG